MAGSSKEGKDYLSSRISSTDDQVSDVCPWGSWGSRRVGGWVPSNYRVYARHQEPMAADNMAERPTLPIFTFTCTLLILTVPDYFIRLYAVERITAVPCMQIQFYGHCIIALAFPISFPYLHLYMCDSGTRCILS